MILRFFGIRRLQIRKGQKIFQDSLSFFLVSAVIMGIAALKIFLYQKKKNGYSWPFLLNTVRISLCFIWFFKINISFLCKIKFFLKKLLKNDKK